MRPIDRMSAAYAELEQQAEAKKQEQDVARREAEAVDLKGYLREQFMALPGTTEAEFEAAYPQLLSDHRRRLMGER